VWEAELDEVRVRAASLDFEAETLAARGEAVRWRLATGFASFYVPLPPVARVAPGERGGWIEDGEFALLSESVGLDARNRPVAVVIGEGTEHEHLRCLFRYPREDVVEQLSDGMVERIALEDGRAVRIVSATMAGHDRVRLVTWRDGVAVRVDGARARKDGGARAEARAATREQAWSAEEDAPAPGGLAAAIERARALEPRELVWDARTQAHEPWPDDSGALVEPLARALDAAVRDAAAASGIEAPFCLHLRNGDDAIDPRPAFPPTALLAGRAYRDGMRRLSARDRLTADDLERGVGAGVVADLQLADRLDDASLRACRALATALDPTSTWERIQAAGPVADAIGERLAELLHARPLPGAAEPFLALVSVGSSYGGADALERARRIAGDDHVDAFLASAAPRLETPAAAPEDRDALERLLAERGLERHARRIAHEIAADGILLEPGAGRSRLGGPPLLPRGERWPDGPLSFLAAIDLSELPDSQVAAGLPASGWLLFFADLDDDDRSRVLYTDVPVDASPPELDAEYVLRDRPVALRRVLTLPDDDDAGQRIGLDVFEAAAYRELVESIQPRDERHWLGGLVADVQGCPVEPGDVLLLHLAYDEALNFPFLDDGTLRFSISATALAERDWSRASTLGTSA
jgi:hypothetical protein